MSKDIIQDSCGSKITSRESQTIGLLQTIAILSVITAHVTAASASENMFTCAIASFMEAFGCIGVVMFFVLGGYFITEKTVTRWNFGEKRFGASYSRG